MTPSKTEGLSNRPKGAWRGTVKKPMTAGMQKTLKSLIARVEVLQNKALTLNRQGYDPLVAQKFDDIEGYMNDAASALYASVDLLESLDRRMIK